MKKIMKRAHEIKREAAVKFNCKPSEIIFSICLEMAHKESKEMKKEITTNKSGFVNFENRDWDYKGDKGTWAKIENDKLTVKISANGKISDAYTEEFRTFCSIYAINFDKMSCGDKITVSI